MLNAGRLLQEYIYMCEASVSRVANARNAAHSHNPIIRIPLVAKWKKVNEGGGRLAAVRGLENFGGDYMRTTSIVLGLEKPLEVVIWATSEICQLVVVAERDQNETSTRM